MMMLLCVTPGEIYVDEDMETWHPVGDLYDEDCQICAEQVGGDGFQSYKTDGFIHSTCVKEVLPCEMFKAYKEHSSMSTILERFLSVFQAGEAEFTKHMLDKGDSWLQVPTDQLYNMVHKVAAKLMLATSRDDCYEELIDLLLCAAMLAQRYLIDEAQDDAEEAGAIPF